MKPDATIQRSEFVDIVERAIEGTPKLAAEDAAALREVAEATKLVGNNFNTDPACPATQAVGETKLKNGTAQLPLFSFAFTYDNLIRAHFNVCYRPEVIQVVDW